MRPAHKPEDLEPPLAYPALPFHPREHASKHSNSGTSPTWVKRSSVFLPLRAISKRFS